MDKKYAEWFRSIVEVEVERAGIGEVGHLDMRFDADDCLHVFVYCLCGCTVYGRITLRSVPLTSSHYPKQRLPAPYLPATIEWSHTEDDLGFDAAPVWLSLQRPGWVMPLGAARP